MAPRQNQLQWSGAPSVIAIGGTRCHTPLVARVEIDSATNERYWFPVYPSRIKVDF